MTFVLRQITKRAAGGEIVRERTLEQASLRIGRGADCEVRVADLAVSLHHATLTDIGRERLRVEAAGREPFGVNGRFVSKADLKVGDAPELTFGDHQINIAPGPGGRVILTLTRTEAAPGQADAATTATLMPRPKILGKRRIAWTSFLAIALLSLILPVLVVYGVLGDNPKIDLDSQWSSGPLSKTHAFLENDCQACHQKAFVAVRDDACMACHSASQTPAQLQKTTARVKAAGSPDAPRLIADHAGTQRLLWGTPSPDNWGEKAFDYARRVFNRPQQRCAACHVEHIGDPIADPVHAKPTLLTAHACADCHAGLDKRLKDTRLANVADWKRHPDLRPLVTVQPGPLQTRRISMADRPADNNGLIFPHDLHLSRAGGPARMAVSLGRGRGYGAPLDCQNCHTPEAKGGNYAPVQMETACGACHSIGALPHGDTRKLVSFFQGSGGRIARTGPTTGRRRPGEPQVYSGVSASAAQRIRGLFAPNGACYGCHASAPPADGSLVYAAGPVRLADAYLTKGSFNHDVPEHSRGANGQPNCARCHAAERSKTAGELLLPRLAVCADCHDAAKQKAKVPQAAGADCADCHSYHAPTRPTPKKDRAGAKAVAAHNRTFSWGSGS
ncbi:MAG TPA: FHA domain-containing protein [Caulobacter sp.]|nr:FHA domain-containing protein [Caulobacter sp.]